MSPPVSPHLARNLKQLREAQGLTQQQCSQSAGIPRPTWANLESGAANPTLSVLVKVAAALRVSVEELISTPKAVCKLYRSRALESRERGGVTVRQLLPDALVGLRIERMELEPRAHLKGIPHTPGTREYLTCERGKIRLVVAGEQYDLDEGDVIVFRGDQKHSYHNPSARNIVAYSVIVLSSQGPM